MALPVYTSKDNAWREYVNPLRGMTLERIVQLIEQSERGSFADLQWFYQASGTLWLCAGQYVASVSSSAPGGQDWQHEMSRSAPVHVDGVRGDECPAVFRLAPAGFGIEPFLKQQA